MYVLTEAWEMFRALKCWSAGWSWSAEWGVRFEVRVVRWSLCPHPAPSCQQLSEPEWSNSSSVCRPQSPLEPVPRLPPTNRQMVNTDGCNYHTRTYTSGAHQSTAVQSHLINFQVWSSPFPLNIHCCCFNQTVQFPTWKLFGGNCLTTTSCENSRMNWKKILPPPPPPLY